MKNLGFATYLKYCTSCSSSIVQEVPQASAVVCKYGRTSQLQKCPQTGIVNMWYIKYMYKYICHIPKILYRKCLKQGVVVCKYGRTPQLQKKSLTRNCKNLQTFKTPRNASSNVQLFANMEEHTYKHFQKRDLAGDICKNHSRLEKYLQKGLEL